MIAYVLVFPAMFFTMLVMMAYVCYKIIWWIIKKLFNIRERDPYDYIHETIDKYNDSII